MISRGATNRDSGRAIKAHGRRLETFEVDMILKSNPIISFVPEDLKDVSTPHSDVLLVTLNVSNYNLARIFVKNGSLVNILFKKTLDQMNVEGFGFDPFSTAIFGCTGHSIQPLGQIMLPLSLWTGSHCATKMTCFIVMDLSSSYSDILV